jgi:hypothetical protein
VSQKLPQNYMIHTVLIAIAIVIAMILFLRHQWGGH